MVCYLLYVKCLLNGFAICYMLNVCYNGFAICYMLNLCYNGFVICYMLNVLLMALLSVIC